jgi:tRNA(Ile)-lysidine synthase
MLIERFKHYIEENELLAEGDKVLLAVSGGVDSMVMLSLFARSGWPVGVAHCNFQLRGEEGDEDTELVKREAERYGLECYIRNFDTRGEVERTGESIQMAARRLRYDWFAELCTEHGYTAIAIAHQADDSIETFFINLFRGTGLRGLTGISVTRGRIIRPLLFATRHEITDYAIVNKIGYREDSSNRSTKYLRNKIRLGLIPRLREINPRFGDIMRRNVDRLTQTQSFIDAGIGRIRGEVEIRKGDTVTIDTEKIDRSFPVGFVIYELLSSSYGFKGDVIDQIVAVLEKGWSGKRFYSRDRVVYTDRGRIIIEPIAQDDPCEVSIEKGAHKVYAGNSAYYMEHIDIDHVETLATPENIALIDADSLTYPLVLRRWREGDRFVPIGMTGSKKVSDYLVDAKVSIPEKQRQFVLVNGGEEGEIVWLVGRRLHDRFKITPRTENVLKITKEVL